MSSNRIDAFIKIEKKADILESYRDFPLVFLMNDKKNEDYDYGEIYVGVLDCIEGEKIYLKDAYEIDEDFSRHIEDDFKKWDLTREDPTINEFPHIQLEFVDSIYVSKFKLTLEQVWNVWSDPRDLIRTQNPTYQKIEDTFSRFEKTFTEKSEPVILNEMGEKLSMKEIYQFESVEDKPISMIAVTRHQYDLSNFPKYVNYVKTHPTLRIDRVYFGLWTDGKKVEYDVLYAIDTDDYEQIQNHLNGHNHMNQGITQVMALIISSDGTTKIVKNSI